jgi:hypothetical protein
MVKVVRGPQPLSLLAKAGRVRAIFLSMGEDKSYKSAVYHPREPEASPLWRLLHNHYECFDLPTSQSSGFSY